MDKSHPSLTSLQHNTGLGSVPAKDVTDCIGFLYWEILDCLNQCTVNTCPDHSHDVSQLAQFSFAYGAANSLGEKQPLSYVRGILESGLVFKKCDAPS